MWLLSGNIQCLIFVYKHETGTAISVFSLLFTFVLSVEDQETGKFLFWLTSSWCILAHATTVVLYCSVSWTESGLLRCSFEMPLSGLLHSLRWQARGKRRVFKALCAAVHTGYRVSVCWSPHCSPTSSWFPSCPSLLCIQLLPPSEVGLSASLSQ